MESLFPYLGILLQWARAQKRFSEWWYAAVVLLAGVGMYAWATPGWYEQDWRVIVGGLKDQILVILGVTQATSTGANLVASTGWINPGHVAVPVTDSK